MGGRSAGEPPMAAPLSPGTVASDCEPWHRYRHLLPTDLRRSAALTQTSASRHGEEGRRALDSPPHPLYTQTLMHPVKPLAGDTIRSQAPIKPSVSTCDKDRHLFS